MKPDPAADSTNVFIIHLGKIADEFSNDFGEAVGKRVLYNKARKNDSNCQEMTQHMTRQMT